MWSGPEQQGEATRGDRRLNRTEVRSLSYQPGGLKNYSDKIVAKMIVDMKHTQINAYLMNDKLAISKDLLYYATHPDALINALLAKNCLPTEFLKSNVMLSTATEFSKAINEITDIAQKKLFILKVLLFIMEQPLWRGGVPQAKGIPTINNQVDNYDISLLRSIHKVQYRYSLQKDCMAWPEVWSMIKSMIFKGILPRSSSPHTEIQTDTSPVPWTTAEHQQQATEYWHDTTLTAGERALVSTYATKLNLPPEWVETTVMGAKAAGIRITEANISAVLTVRRSEWRNRNVGGQIDVTKSPQQIKEYVDEIESKIGKIMRLLDDFGDQYFEQKLQEVRGFVSENRDVSQFRLFQRTQQIAQDIQNNISITVKGETRGLKDALAESLNDSNIFDAALSWKNETKYPWETNVDILVRILKSKPSSFGKYEIKPDLLVQRMIANPQGLWPIEQKVLLSDGNGRWNRDTYQKENLVRAMQWQEGSTISQLELEYLYRKYYFAPSIQEYGENGSLTEESTRALLFDHNQWLYATRNAGIQNALKKKTGARIKIDGDLTYYNKYGEPYYHPDSATVKSLMSYVQNNYTGRGKENPSQLVKEFVELSRSPTLDQHPLYQHIMADQWPVYTSISSKTSTYADKGMEIRRSIT